MSIRDHGEAADAAALVAGGAGGGVPDDAGAPAEDAASVRARARIAISDWITRSGRAVLRKSPLAVVTAMTAAALAPLLQPALTGGGGPAVLQQLLIQLGGVGAAHVATVLEDVVARHRGPAGGTAGDPQAAQDELEQRLAEQLAGPDAPATRAEMAQLLRAVGGVDEALRTAREADVPGLTDYLVDAVSELGQAMAEFRDLQYDVLATLLSIHGSLHESEQTRRAEFRHLNTQITLLKMEVTRDRPAGERAAGELSGTRRPAIAAGPAGAAGPAAGEPSRICPYPGLATFSETDAQWFHGRKRLTAALVSQLRERLLGHSPLIVAGASGAGKSSLLRAGLIPALDAGLVAGPGSEHWHRMIMTPGAQPFRDLVLRLADLARLTPSQVQDELTADPARASLIIRQGLLSLAERQRYGVVTTAPVLTGHSDAGRGGTDRRLVLVIDQFEEIFTQCEDGEERMRFIEAVCAAAQGTPRDPPAALVVIGIRMGFLEECTAHPVLEPALLDPLVVGPMSTRELREAIEQPARQAGLTVEAGLAAAMLRDLGAVEPPDGSPRVTYDPGRLPLLAHALRETWERGGGPLTIAAYDAAGGIQNALAAKADQVLASFDPPTRLVARRLLEHMVLVHADGEDTRRQMSRAALLGELPAADAVTAGQILDRLEAERLVTVDRDRVQLVHEALLKYWPTLAEWVREDRSWRREQQRLTERARDWANGGRHPGLLLSSPQLAALRSRLTSERRAELGGRESEYLALSEARVSRAERSRRAVVAVLTVLVVLAGGLAVIAQDNSGRAQHDSQSEVQQRRIAESGELASEAVSLRAANPEISLLLSLEAYRIDPSYEAVSNLLSAQTSFPTARLSGSAGPASAVAYDPAAPVLASAAHGPAGPASAGGVITLWNAQTQRVIATLPGRSAFFSVAFNPAGTMIAGAEQDGTTVVWDVRTRRPLGLLRVSGDPVTTVAFSPDGQFLAAAGNDGKVTLWRAATLTAVRTLSTGVIPETVWGIAFSPDGNRLAAACADHNVRVWSLAQPSQPPLVLPGHTAQVRTVAFSPDSALLASGSDDGTVRLWSARTGALTAVLPGTAGVGSVAFSPDSRLLASGSADGAIRLWDVATGTQAGALAGPAAAVNGLAFGTQGHTLASAAADGTVSLWDIPSLPNAQAAESAAAAVAATEPLGRGPVVTAGAGQQGPAITVWAPPRGISYAAPQVTAPLPVTLPQSSGQVLPNPVASVALCAGGKVLAVPLAGASRPGVALLRTADLRQADELSESLPVDSVACHADSRSLVIAGGSSGDGVFFWRPPSPPVQVAEQSGVVDTVAFSPDGRLLAAGTQDGPVLLFSGAASVGPDSQPLSQALGPVGPVESVAFSPDSTLMASVSQGATGQPGLSGPNPIRLWDVRDPARPVPLASLSAPSPDGISVAFGAAGTLAVSTAEGTIQLWDVSQPRRPARLATLTGLASPSTVAFLPGTRTLVSAAADGTPVFWDTSPGAVARSICASHPSGNGGLLAPYLDGVRYQRACP